MGNLMSMRGGFLGQLISGGPPQRDKDCSPAAGLLAKAALVLARFGSIVASTSNNIYQLDISTQDGERGAKKHDRSAVAGTRARVRAAHPLWLSTRCAAYITPRCET